MEAADDSCGGVAGLLPGMLGSRMYHRRTSARCDIPSAWPKFEEEGDKPAAPVTGFDKMAVEPSSIAYQLGNLGAADSLQAQHAWQSTQPRGGIKEIADILLSKCAASFHLLPGLPCNTAQLAAGSGAMTGFNFGKHHDRPAQPRVIANGRRKTHY